MSVERYATDNGIHACEIPPEHCFSIGRTKLVCVDSCDEWLQACQGEGKTALYRHFDEHGNLLYVGISLSAVSRLKGHKRSRWFSKISTVTIEWLPDRDSAIAAEIAAIKSECPVYNVVHNNVAN